MQLLNNFTAEVQKDDTTEENTTELQENDTTNNYI